ncbi:MAG: hypothetical protein V4580_17390 [Bacteroidota bacterium]
MFATLEKQINDNEVLRVRVSLDNTMNGYDEFCVTGDIYSRKGNRSESKIVHGKFTYWYYTNSGTEDILKHFPKLAPLVKLHDCDVFGMPSYPIVNQMHYFKENDLETPQRLLRLTDDEVKKMSKMKILPFIVKLKELSETRYKDEVKEAIETLETLSGQKYIQKDFISPRLYNDISYSLVDDSQWNIYKAQRKEKKITEYLHI